MSVILQHRLLFFGGEEGPMPQQGQRATWRDAVLVHVKQRCKAPRVFGAYYFRSHLRWFCKATDRGRVRCWIECDLLIVTRPLGRFCCNNRLQEAIGVFRTRLGCESRVFKEFDEIKINESR